MAAERDSNDRYISAYMSNRLGGEFAGRISGVTRFGLFIRLAETGADGLLPVRSLGREYFHHNERTHSLVGESTGLTFRLGAAVKVRLAEATPLTGGLRFDLIEGGVPGNPVKTRRPNKPPQGRKMQKRRR
jgi:ribonuclease R